MPLIAGTELLCASLPLDAASLYPDLRSMKEKDDWGWADIAWSSRETKYYMNPLSMLGTLGGEVPKLYSFVDTNSQITISSNPTARRGAQIQLIRFG